MMLKMYGITQGVLAIDDTENDRCKKTPLIAYTHKYYDKKTGGYKNGQELVFMVLVTDNSTPDILGSFFKLCRQIWFAFILVHVNFNHISFRPI